MPRKRHGLQTGFAIIIANGLSVKNYGRKETKGWQCRNGAIKAVTYISVPLTLYTFASERNGRGYIGTCSYETTPP